MIFCARAMRERFHVYVPLLLTAAQGWFDWWRESDCLAFLYPLE